MMTQQLGFSILSAPLAAIDRRALSQAWYSSLHLAQEAQSRPTAKPVQATTQARRATKAQPEPAKATAPRVLRSPQIRGSATTKSRGSAAPALNDRRSVRSPLARKIERIFLDPRRRVHQATFTVDGTKSRIHIALQTVGNRVRMIALCPPNLRATVAEALSQARYALAAHGIDVAFETNEH